MKGFQVQRGLGAERLGRNPAAGRVAPWLRLSPPWVRQRKRAGQVQKQKGKEERKEKRRGRFRQERERVPPDLNGQKKRVGGPEEGKPVLIDLPPGADQFPKALCQVRQGEADDDREESGDVFRLARGAVSVCLGAVGS